MGSSRRKLVPAVVAVTLVATLGVPGVAGGQAPGQDSVVGSLTQGLGRGTTSFTINAFSGPAGEQPGGTVIAESFFLGRVNLTVACLQVTGARAVILARLPAPTGLAQVSLIIVDAPAGEQDRIKFGFGVGTGPGTCAEADDGTTPEPALFGSVVVTDAQPLPTTKAQCKHGGWAQFGFRHQGQCIRFVRLIPGPGPYPSTREQCRHGGWGQFGFDNKRKCLRFVRLKPKP